MSKYYKAEDIRDAIKDLNSRVFLERRTLKPIIEMFVGLPTIDIVYCKDCKYSEYREDFDDYECFASGCGLVYTADFFCADGERVDNE